MTNKWLRQYKGYVILLLPEIFLAVVLQLPETLKGTKMCLDNSVCGWSLTVTLLLIIPLPVLLVYEKKISPILQRWNLINARNSKKVFSLTQSQKQQDGTIFLDLCNKRINPTVTVSQIEIGNKDRIFSRRNETFALDKGKRKEIAFIKVSEIYKYYSIVDDIKETDFDQFRQKKNRFDISVEYDNGSIQWFEVTVIYVEPNKITLEISDE